MAPKVIARLGVKPTIVAGLLVLATGMVLLSLIRADGSFLVDVLPASMIAAAGLRKLEHGAIGDLAFNACATLAIQ